MRVVATRHRRLEGGVVAVEFALLFPLLCMLLMGIVTGGLSYSNALGVQNAVREGARFGATGDQASSTWAADVSSRVRTTQFDDSSTAATSETSVCVQLVKAPSTVVQVSCSAGGPDSPILTMPLVADYPAVPATVPAGTCVVRVVTARSFSVNIILDTFESSIRRGAVARYERTC